MFNPKENVKPDMEIIYKTVSGLELPMFVFMPKERKI